VAARAIPAMPWSRVLSEASRTIFPGHDLLLGLGRMLVSEDLASLRGLWGWMTHTNYPSEETRHIILLVTVWSFRL